MQSLTDSFYNNYIYNENVLRYNNIDYKLDNNTNKTLDKFQRYRLKKKETMTDLKRKINVLEERDTDSYIFRVDASTFTAKKTPRLDRAYQKLDEFKAKVPDPTSHFKAVMFEGKYFYSVFSLFLIFIIFIIFEI